MSASIASHPWIGSINVGSGVVFSFHDVGCDEGATISTFESSTGGDDTGSTAGVPFVAGIVGESDNGIGSKDERTGDDVTHTRVDPVGAGVLGFGGVSDGNVGRGVGRGIEGGSPGGDDECVGVEAGDPGAAGRLVGKAEGLGVPGVGDGGCKVGAT